MYTLSNSTAEEVELESAKLRDFLINEEGVSETWAKRIIDSFIANFQESDFTTESVHIKNKDIKECNSKESTECQSNKTDDNKDELSFQEFIDRMIDNIRPVVTPFGEFTYSDARLYLERQILKDTLIIPKGYYTIAPNAIDGLSVEKLYIPSSVHNIPEKLFRSAWKLKNIYVSSTNSYYKSQKNGKELYDTKKNKLIYRIKD